MVSRERDDLMSSQEAIQRQHQETLELHHHQQVHHDLHDHSKAALAEYEQTLRIRDKEIDILRARLEEMQQDGLATKAALTETT